MFNIYYIYFHFDFKTPFFIIKKRRGKLFNNLLTEIQEEIRERGISKEEVVKVLSSIPSITTRRIIKGVASVDIVDREQHRITIPALKEAVKKFMVDEHYRSLIVFHSDVIIGRILPYWTNPETGEIHKTEVKPGAGWIVVCELRDDTEVANKVWDEIIKGNLKSFSIAGSAKKKIPRYENGQMFYDIEELEIVECTICETPVNQLAKFDVLWVPKQVSV